VLSYSFYLHHYFYLLVILLLVLRYFLLPTLPLVLVLTILLICTGYFCPTALLPLFFRCLGLVFLFLQYYLHFSLYCLCFSVLLRSVFTLCNIMYVSNLACSLNISLHEYVPFCSLPFPEALLNAFFYCPSVTCFYSWYSSCSCTNFSRPVRLPATSTTSTP
jgi:hypothetical protein